MLTPEDAALLDAAAAGFAGLSVSRPVVNAALANLSRWLSEPTFAAYRYQIVGLIERARWDVLVDSFYQVLPFGTGGRRGQVGIGPNRFNPWTLAASVQGHAAWLRRTCGDGALSVVIAYDVREFRDLGGRLVPGTPNPVLGMSSRDFAQIAAEVYAAAGMLVYLSPAGTYLATPELSFAIRFLGADGGVNISASHNPPDDNGSKFYNSTGGQEIPPNDERMAEEVAGVVHIDRMPLDRARAVGLVRELGPEVHAAYVAKNLSAGLCPDARGARVAFTGLHGLGINTVVPVLQAAGFDVLIEPTQAPLDGAFPHVPFRAPNPEVPRSMAAAVSFAEENGADIVMASDPDADRLGLEVRHPGHAAGRGAWRFMNGNEVATLVCAHILQHRNAEHSLVIKTEVTSMLVERVARHLGATVVGHLLVGFKYIGDALDQLETRGSFAGISASLSDFALGAEESHGLLITPAIRDKDAAGGALMLAELASLEKARGRTLVDALEQLWREVGYVRNELVSTVMRGAEGRARIQQIQASLRADPPAHIGGRPITAFHDRQDPSGPFGEIQSETDRASRDVLVFELGADARVILRPSGTEPKNKIYVEVAGRPGADLADEIQRVNREARALADDFTLDMLLRVGLSLPRWALRVNDLVSVEHKIQLAASILPALVSQLEAGDADAGKRLDIQLAPFGRDGRGLVAEAVRAWLVEQSSPPTIAPALLDLFRGW